MKICNNKNISSEDQLREIIKPLLEGHYHRIKIFLIPSMKEISFVEIDLYRSNLYGGDIELKLSPEDIENRIWIVRKKGDKNPITTSVDDIVGFFKNYIIQKKALHLELMEESVLFKNKWRNQF